MIADHFTIELEEYFQVAATPARDGAPLTFARILAG